MSREVNRSATSRYDSNLVRGTVRPRGDEGVKEETKKPKLKCLILCNVVQKMESKLIENNPTSVATRGQHQGETAVFVDTSTRENEVLR